MPVEILFNPGALPVSCDGAHYVAASNTNHAEDLLQREPGGLSGSWGEVIDPDRSVAEKECLEDAQDETAEDQPEVSIIVGEDKAGDGIAERGQDQDGLGGDTLHDQGHKKGSHTSSHVGYSSQESDLALRDIEVFDHLKLRGGYHACVEVEEQSTGPEERE